MASRTVFANPRTTSAMGDQAAAPNHLVAGIALIAAEESSRGGRSGLVAPCRESRNQLQ